MMFNKNIYLISSPFFLWDVFFLHEVFCSFFLDYKVQSIISWNLDLFPFWINSS